jgi:hypothetical protein
MNRLPQIEEHTACDVCHRTMLKGEWAEPYLTPSRERRLVCQLCAPHAQREGWIRETAAPDAPAQPQRQPEGRGLFRRFARRREHDREPGREVSPEAPPETYPEAHTAAHPEGAAAFPEAAPVEPDAERPRRIDPHESNGQEHPPEEPVFTRLRNRAAGPRKPRHVRAVPTNAQLKIDRALDLFNRSEHPRTIAGIARSLGAPHASALTSGSSAAEVVLTVAWELSWYQFTVDLSDPREPVQVRAQGQELAELDEEARSWNLEADPEGRLAPPAADSDQPGGPVTAGASAAKSGGEEPS